MQTGRHLNSRRCELAGGTTVDDDLSALGTAVHLRPRDVRSLRQLNIQWCLNVFYLNGSRVGLVSLQTQHQVVLSGSERKNDRSLPRLFGAVNENVGSRGLGGDEDALGQRLELELLVLRFVAFNLQRGLQGLIAFLLHFQAVSLRFEIIKTAGSLALA